MTADDLTLDKFTREGIEAARVHFEDATGDTLTLDALLSEYAEYDNCAAFAVAHELTTETPPEDEAESIISQQTLEWYRLDSGRVLICY